MCLGMNPDQLAPGERSASTSNRNFEGRQGKGGRTHLVSPPVAAATAVARPPGRARRPADARGVDDGAFTTHTGRAVPLRRSNVDTDQIIPAVWLKRVTRTGFEDGPVRRLAQGPGLRAQPARSTTGASILVAGPDFGTGSSREHAVWALQNYGFRVVIAPRFGDIFRGNSSKDGPARREVAAGRRRAALEAASRPTPAARSRSTWRRREVRCRRRASPLRDRRLHPLAAAGGPGRHRSDPAARRRHGVVREWSAAMAADDRLTRSEDELARRLREAHRRVRALPIPPAQGQRLSRRLLSHLRCGQA